MRLNRFLLVDAIVFRFACVNASSVEPNSTLVRSTSDQADFPAQRVMQDSTEEEYSSVSDRLRREKDVNCDWV